MWSQFRQIFCPGGTECRIAHPLPPPIRIVSLPRLTQKCPSRRSSSLKKEADIPPIPECQENLASEGRKGISDCAKARERGETRKFFRPRPPPRMSKSPSIHSLREFLPLPTPHFYCTSYRAWGRGFANVAHCYKRKLSCFSALSVSLGRFLVLSRKPGREGALTVDRKEKRAVTYLEMERSHELRIARSKKESVSFVVLTIVDSSWRGYLCALYVRMNL